MHGRAQTCRPWRINSEDAATSHSSWPGVYAYSISITSHFTGCDDDDMKATVDKGGLGTFSQYVHKYTNILNKQKT